LCCEHARVIESRVVPLPSGGAVHIDGERDGAGTRSLLFLHGVGGGAWSWEPQRAALRTNHRVLTWEARGHGCAAPVDDAGFADYLQDAREALTVAASAGPPVVVGHSMGGFIALILAAERAMLSGLVLIDPVYDEHNRAHVPEALRPIARVAIEPVIRSAVRGGRLARGIGRLVFDASFTDRSARERWWPAQAAQQPLEFPLMFEEGISGVSRIAFRPFARDVAVPTLLLNGRFAALRAGLREGLGARFADESMPGGHYLQLDRPDAVTERLRRFLAEDAAP